MALNTLNTDAISFKKLSGKAHTQQNFAVTEEGISSNVQLSFTTVFANPIEPLPVTNSGLTTLFSTNGIIERIRFEVDLIPNTQIAVNRSQGYRLKLPAGYTGGTHGQLYPKFGPNTYLYTALGKLQIVPPLYGTLKIDGSTEYDPILRQIDTNVIGKFDPINWYLDYYNGILFVQDPPVGYDISASRPAYVDAYLYVGDYINDVLLNITGSTGSTGQNIGGGVGVFKDVVQTTGGTTVLRFKTFVGSSGLTITQDTDNVFIGLSATGSSATLNIYSPKTIISGNTTLSSSNYVVFCNTAAGAFTVTLPASPTDGQAYKIKDIAGFGFIYNVTISGNGKNIDGNPTALINTNNGAMEVCYDATLDMWSVMSFVN